MCGIVGFTNNISNSDEVLSKMMDRIKHRGPDAYGKYIDDDIALGHRRLSIIDVSSSGDQPIFNEDNTLVIIFNGEIYNYMSIKKVRCDSTCLNDAKVTQGHILRVVLGCE